MVRLHKNTRFEAEIHIGLMAIVFLLLALNLISNIVIYRARTVSREMTESTLNMAALATSKAISEVFPQKLDRSELDRIREFNGLTSLILVPGQPETESKADRRIWFAQITKHLPPGQLPDLALKLVGAERDVLTRGDENEFFTVKAIPSGTDGYLLIASSNNPTLAFLDGSGATIILISLGALLIIAVAYLFVYRYIFSPFRQISQIATNAGRATTDRGTDVEAIIEDYRRIIEELEADKVILRQLNETIANKAQSLEQFNEYLLESIESGIVTLDMSGNLITISPKAAEIFGVESLEFQGELYDRLFGPFETLKRDIEMALNDGQLPPYQEHQVRLSENRLGVLGVTLSPVRDKNEQRLGYSILITDHTELHRLQQELESRKRLTAMGEMAGGLAHQLRNSLGAISGYGTLIKRKMTNSGLPVKPVEELLDETKEASELIKQFLDFTKPFQLAAVRTSLQEFLHDLLESCRSRSDGSNAQLRLEPFQDQDLLLDPLLLKQALGNIIDNALESYGDQHGPVTVAVATDKSDVQISVSDQGCGIRPDELDQIFTPFFSRRPSGTGLGLPLAAKFINLHDGRIAVKSQPGQGTTFTITLPVRRPETALNPVK
jgi:PAS domain S-box-containing protein